MFAHHMSGINWLKNLIIAQSVGQWSPLICKNFELLKRPYVLKKNFEKKIWFGFRPIPVALWKKFLKSWRMLFWNFWIVCGVQSQWSMVYLTSLHFLRLLYKKWGMNASLFYFLNEYSLSTLLKPQGSIFQNGFLILDYHIKMPKYCFSIFLRGWC